MSSPSIPRGTPRLACRRGEDCARFGRSAVRGRDTSHAVDVTWSPSEYFLECVKDRGLPITDVRSHVNAVNACHMANVAMLLGRKVRCDTKKYEFPGDSEANAFAKRPQRQPYSIDV